MNVFILTKSNLILPDMAEEIHLTKPAQEELKGFDHFNKSSDNTHNFELFMMVVRFNTVSMCMIRTIAVMMYMTGFFNQPEF